MTEIQEKEWLIAKGLKTAISIKKPSIKFKFYYSAEKLHELLEENYGGLAGAVAVWIWKNAKLMAEKELLQ
jgi:hypothetical protein